MLRRWILLLAVMCSAPSAYSMGLTEQEQLAFGKINEMRARVGLPAFELNAELTEGSRVWSAKMRERRYLGHDDPVRGFGIGENCARGSVCGEATAWQWYNARAGRFSPPGSSGHRSLLMSRAKEAGIGQDGEYWTFRVRYRERETVPRAEPVVLVPLVPVTEHALTVRKVHRAPPVFAPVRHVLHKAARVFK